MSTSFCRRQFMISYREQATTAELHALLFANSVWVFFANRSVVNIEGSWDHSFSREKIRESTHLQIRAPFTLQKKNGSGPKKSRYGPDIFTV